MLKLQLFKLQLDLAKGKLDWVVLRRVRHDPDPFEVQLSHQALDILGLVYSEVIHHDHDLLILIDLREPLKKDHKLLLINRLVKQLYILIAKVFAYRCFHSSVLLA